MYDTFPRDKFIAISSWSDGNEENMSNLANEQDLTYPLISASLNQFERDNGIPTYVLIGPGHELLMVDEGRPSNEVIQGYIDEFGL